MANAYFGGYTQAYAGESGRLALSTWPALAAALILVALLSYHGDSIEAELRKNKVVKRVTFCTAGLFAIGIAVIAAIRHMSESPAVWMKLALTPYILSATSAVLAITFICNAFRKVDRRIASGAVIAYSIGLTLYIFQFYAGCHIDLNLTAAIFMVCLTSLVLYGGCEQNMCANPYVRFAGALFAVWVMLAPYSALELRLAALIATAAWTMLDTPPEYPLPEPAFETTPELTSPESTQETECD